MAHHHDAIFDRMCREFTLTNVSRMPYEDCKAPGESKQEQMWIEKSIKVPTGPYCSTRPKLGSGTSSGHPIRNWRCREWVFHRRVGDNHLRAAGHIWMPSGPLKGVPGIRITVDDADF